MLPRLDLPRLCAPPTAAVRSTFPAAHPQPARPLTAREMQLAADVEMARGNPQRGELLSWAAHDARSQMSA